MDIVEERMYCTFLGMCITFAVAIIRDAETGAATSVNCAVNPRLDSQRCFYYDSCQIKESSTISRHAKILRICLWFLVWHEHQPM